MSRVFCTKVFSATLSLGLNFIYQKEFVKKQALKFW